MSEPSTGRDLVEDNRVISELYKTACDERAHFARECERLKHELATAQAVIRNDCETETQVREICRKHLVPLEVDGDSNGVPTLADVVEKIEQKLRDSEDRLTHVLTSLEEGTLPWWQKRHSDLAVKHLELANKLRESEAECAAMREALQSCHLAGPVHKEFFDQNKVRQSLSTDAGKSLLAELDELRADNQSLLNALTDWRYSHDEIEAACGGETALSVRAAVNKRRLEIDPSFKDSDLEALRARNKELSEIASESANQRQGFLAEVASLKTDNQLLREQIRVGDVAFNRQRSELQCASDILGDCKEILNEVVAHGNCDCDIPNGHTCIPCECALLCKRINSITTIPNELDALRERVKEGECRPKLICICGSSRFVAESAVKAWELNKQGIATFFMPLLPQWYPGVNEHHQAEAEGVAEQLDNLWLRLIQMADEVFVMNCGGYIGERTAIEIEHAHKLGKPVRFQEKRRDKWMEGVKK